MAHQLNIPPGADLNKYKPDIIKLVEEYLIDNSLIDLTGFIHNDLNIPEPNGNSAFIRDIANRMKRTGHYDIIEQENGKRFLVYPLPPKKWSERNPFLRDVIVTVCAAILSLIVGWLLQKVDSQRQQQIDTQQNTDITLLKDSLKGIQSKVLTLTDSLNKISSSQSKINTIKK